MKSYEISIPENSLIRHALNRVDYEDAFAVHIPSGEAIDPARVVHLFFECIPFWFTILIGIRETIAGWIGLKTANKNEVEKQLKAFTGQPGESIALFHVKGRTEEEILMGENDSHLDFRLSFLSKPMAKGYEIALLTSVQFNNRVGRAYFIPVKPVHRIIVKVLLNRMAKRLIQQRMSPAV